MSYERKFIFFRKERKKPIHENKAVSILKCLCSWFSLKILNRPCVAQGTKMAKIANKLGLN